MKHPNPSEQDRNSLKQRENKIQTIWNKIQDIENLDILLILYSLSELIGKKDIN